MHCVVFLEPQIIKNNSTTLIPHPNASIPLPNTSLSLPNIYTHQFSHSKPRFSISPRLEPAIIFGLFINDVNVNLTHAERFKVGTIDWTSMVY
jgi:hypothetical protein